MFNEEKCRKIFENIFKEKCPNVRPSWLMNHDTGFLLELDGYCQSLKLAFEYDGIQHYEYPNIFHKNQTEFYRQKMRDMMKNYKCKIFGVTLIRIKYDVENIESFIREGLRNKGYL